MTEDTTAHKVLFGQLMTLARGTQVSVDLDDADHYGYRFGEHTAYAHAAGLCLTLATDPRHFTVADRMTQGLSDGVTELTKLTAAATAVATDTPARERSPLEWVGPAAFQARYGDAPGTVHEYGTMWGPRHDIRITLRRPFGATAGLLFAYDASWDEYAVLHPHVAAEVVEAAVAEALQTQPQMPPEQLTALIRRHEQDRQIGPAPCRALGVER